MTQAAETGAPAGTSGLAPDRNLALELVRVTESAAMAAGRWIGRGDKISADQAAVDGMRHMLGTTNMAGVVVIGEGEKDEAPMLYNGEEVGDGNGPEVDVAVDPLGVVVEHPRDRAVPLPCAVMVGPEHVDRAVEAPLELVDEVDDVRSAVRRLAPLLG